MRTGLFLSALVLSACAARPPGAAQPAGQSKPPAAVQPGTVRLATGGTLRLIVNAGKAALEVTPAGGKAITVPLERDEMVDANEAFLDFRLIGEVKDAAIVADGYQSAKGGLSLCAAGEERFLRVIALSGKETLRLKVASCRQELELESPGWKWNAAEGVLEVRWLTGPGKGTESRRYRIEAGGAAKRID